MDFSWPDHYINYREDIENFVREEINPILPNKENRYDFPENAWQRNASYGILKMPLNTYKSGRDQLPFSQAMLAMEGYGYACNSNALPFGLNAVMWTVIAPLVKFSSDDIFKKYVVPMSEGKLKGCHCLTEPDHGSDVYNMQTTATKVEGGYLINGTKHLITLGPISDVAFVLTSTDPDRGKWGLSAFLIETNSPGVTVHDRKYKMGLQSIPIGGFDFKDCFVPNENMVGKPGMGFSILNYSLEYDRCCILASQLGSMQRQLEKAIKRANERQQFGQKIGKFQAVSHRIADMKLRLETARLLLYKTAWLKENGKPATLEGAMLKLHLSESFLQSSLDVMRTYGGVSYLEDYGIEEDTRDAIGGILYAGTSDIQRNIIASLLGL